MILKTKGAEMMDIVSSPTKNNKHIMLMFFVGAMGIFLHQTTRTSFGNNSVADLILLISIIYLLIFKKLLVPRVVLIIFLFVSSLFFINALFIVPIRFEITSSLKSFIFDYMKILVLILYFILGYSIAKLGLSRLLIKYYSYTAFIVSVVGLLISIVNFNPLSQYMYIYGSRLNGFMNDPNYFAILQLSALPYFLFHNKLNVVFRTLVSICLLISMVLSGSKTGILIACIITIAFLLSVFRKSIKTISTTKVLKYFVGFIVLIGIYSTLLYFKDVIITLIFSQFPILERTTVLFSSNDFGLSSGGSGRSNAWNTALSIIALSPFLGIGISNYLTIGEKFFDTRVLAHNTYLQLAAEWGLPLAILFISYIIFLIVRIKKITSLQIYRSMLIIFLIGSFSISLNNARIFWILLGLISFVVFKPQARSTTKMNE